MDVVVQVVLPIVTLASGWALASWNSRRHRNWDALSADLDLADKLKNQYPEHAKWIRDSVAVRLKGRALSDSRFRSDFLVVAVGVLVSLFGGFCLLIGVTSLRHAEERVETWMASGPLVAAVFFVVSGAFMIFSGIRSSPRLPGVSELFLPQGKKIQDQLFDQLKILHSNAMNLPDAFAQLPERSADTADANVACSAAPSPDRDSAPR